jgi:hypothetical protein
MFAEVSAYVEYAPLSSYVVVFQLNGKRTEETVKANSVSQAKDIIKARYSGQKVQILSAKKE